MTPDQDKLFRNVVRLLDDERAFIDRTDRCMQQIAAQTVGKPFPKSLVEELINLHNLTVQRSRHRSQTANELAALNGGRTVQRLSEISFGEDRDALLREKRIELQQKAEQLRHDMRALSARLRETTSLVSSVLEVMTGMVTDTSRYDAHGRPVRRTTFA